MDSVLFILVCIIILGLTFDFINGFHDTANTIATSVSTRALPPQVAIVMAALMNFFGALLFTGVAQTITKDIVDPFSLENGSIVLLCALIGAIAWNLITWYYGIPSSSSHALVGSIAGAAIVSEGLWSLNYSGFIRILEALLISPVAALIIGFLVMSLFKIVFRNSNLAKTNKGFRILQIMTAALQSFSHGTNDAQKTMGIMTMALITAGFQTTTDIPTWIRVSVALAMGLGTMVGGWRIIKTVGGKITKLKPVSGAAADLSSAFIIFGFTFLHLPVSTTHVISSSIMGVGSAQRVKDVKWGVARRIVFTWIITMPITALLSACLYKVVMLFV
ncbi:inorganic phosphate transporter [Brevibacillus laterosporus]|uniref:Low-affinity inorganic phosphate transporter 1 n=1 Tax=Brevibacillus laterosporus LMG 15441 TaxID=1042163 RepID=A0A075R6T8_BRELA|nr:MULTISPECIES: inorganic phosphate transporter [Brevibacillus]AIG26893.1 Low-affinity inorganic phosphate transporter 1 [Brevibacillus laterosporus LMG 15441]ERM18847.1 inorganic phosphate transporter [Brevibacillus laterosporus PE36]MBA4534506.1 inorganic phosphate transporter [Brevibacillus halotolerans]PCN46342.1 inorganic phosphate transporter [Brevibacillus laterosporus]RJL14787.1 inorganic phosphate transporter [Brevibacillus laterosporus]